MSIRSALPADAPHLAALQTAAYLGQFPASTESVLKRLSAYLVTVHTGEVTATLLRWETSPGHLRLQLMGEPGDFAGLYTHLLAHLPESVTALQSVVREDHAPQMAFLAAVGFRNAHQSWGAHLTLAGFDFAPFLSLEERLFMAGVEIEMVAQNASDTRWAALHALFLEGLQDMPRNPTTMPDALGIEEFQSQARQDHLFVASYRQIPIAFTWLSVRGREVEGEHTVTTLVWRGCGVATLLKAHSLVWAKASGFQTASTGGTLLNLPILRVNARLGYAVEPMWVTWARQSPFASLPVSR